MVKYNKWFDKGWNTLVNIYPGHGKGMEFSFEAKVAQEYCNPMTDAFKNALVKHQTEDEPITVALRIASKFATAHRLTNTEVDGFQQWFEDNYYENGKPKQVFRYPIIDEVSLLLV